MYVFMCVCVCLVVKHGKKFILRCAHTDTHTHIQRILNQCVSVCVYVFDLEFVCLCVFVLLSSIIQEMFNIDGLIGMDHTV